MKGEFVQLSKSQNMYIMNVIAKFILLFMSLLTALIVKNSYFDWNLLCFSLSAVPLTWSYWGIEIVVSVM